MGKEKTNITVETTVNAPVEKMWKYWTQPEHITKWNFASDDWHSPRAENDLHAGGKFNFRMEAKNKSFGFDFEGTYTNIKEKTLIEYEMADGRKARVSFSADENKTKVIETFEAESENPIEMQRGGWQAILDNFKKHVEKPATEKLRFNISINAPVETVYDKMLNEQSYKEWTSAFNPSSHYKGSWEKGSKILFIGTDEKGNSGGMVSRIKENIPGKFISIEHRGILQGDKEITSGPEVESWAGALENYSFTKQNGGTNLEVEMDANDEFKSYFQEIWPKALDKLKKICES